jgi:hypothetical protein
MKKLIALGAVLILPILFSFGPHNSSLGASSFPGAAGLSGDGTNLVVHVKKKKKKDNGDNNSGTQPDTTGGEVTRDCPVGYVALDKPNKYGALCEPKEGVCKKGMIGTPPDCKCPEGTLPLGNGDNPCVAKQNCPFPGQVGNPPNCDCPQGTEFVGYKGCVKYEDKENCEAFTLPGDESKMTDFTVNCKNREGKIAKGPKDTIHLEPGQHAIVGLCCDVRYYEK